MERKRKGGHSDPGFKSEIFWNLGTLLMFFIFLIFRELIQVKEEQRQLMLK